MNHILFCKKCAIYTMQEACPKCQTKTFVSAPPKYSPEDKYSKYRQIAVFEERVKRGLL